MATVVKNDKGFKIINLSKEEASSLDFGLSSGACVCMHCNKYCIKDIYYIAVLNDTMCKSCYEHWLKGATRYSDDTPIEDKNFNYYKEALGL